jgi:hypothetical protein
MAKLRRGGYVFLAWAGDHAPRHVHVFRNGKLIAKWDLDEDKVMMGKASRRVKRLIEDLREEGLL